MSNIDKLDMNIFGKGEVNSNLNFVGKSYLKTLSTNKDCPIYNVTFEPGCRNNWHLHPGGQILLVISGIGWYQEINKEAIKITAGDVIEIAPNVMHWHGASKENELTHVAIEVNPKEGAAQWFEEVADVYYNNL